MSKTNKGGRPTKLQSLVKAYDEFNIATEVTAHLYKLGYEAKHLLKPEHVFEILLRNEVRQIPKGLIPDIVLNAELSAAGGYIRIVREMDDMDKTSDTQKEQSALEQLRAIFDMTDVGDSVDTRLTSATLEIKYYDVETDQEVFSKDHATFTTNYTVTDSRADLLGAVDEELYDVFDEERLGFAIDIPFEPLTVEECSSVLVDLDIPFTQSLLDTNANYASVIIMGKSVAANELADIDGITDAEAIDVKYVAVVNIYIED